MKNLMKKAILPVVLATAFISINSFAEPAHEHNSKHDKSEKHVNALKKELNLSDAQKASIETFIKEHKKDESNPMIEEKLEKLKALTMKKDFDEAEAKTIINEINELKTEHQLNKVKLQHKIYNELTPEQQQKYNDKMHTKAKEKKEDEKAAKEEVEEKINKVNDSIEHIKD